MAAEYVNTILALIVLAIYDVLRFVGTLLRGMACKRSMYSPSAICARALEIC